MIPECQLAKQYIRVMSCDHSVKRYRGVEMQSGKKWQVLVSQAVGLRVRVMFRVSVRITSYHLVAIGAMLTTF